MSVKEILQVEYKRFINNNYILLYCNKDGIIKNYQTRMILENCVPGLLPMSIRYMNRREILYYDITSKQPLGRVFENTEISYDQVRMLLMSLAQIYENVQKYLLNAKHLVLEPEYIYVDVETMEINILFCPEFEKEAKSAIRDLAEFFLNRVNHKDEKAVVLIYQFYKNTREENFSLEMLLITLLQKSDEEEETSLEEINIYQKDNYIPVLVTSKELEIDNEIQENKKMKKRNKEQNIKQRKKQNTEQKNKEQNNCNQENSNLRKYKDAAMIPIGGCMLIIGILLNSFKVVNYEQGIVGIGISLMILAVGIIVTIQKHVKKEDALEEVHKDFEEEDLMEEESPDEIEIFDFLIDVAKPSKVAEEKIAYGSTVFIERVNIITTPKLVQNKNGLREEYLLDKFPFVIGKDKGQSNLIIESKEISRTHARFIEKENLVYLEDMNSTNGTFKNGIQLENNEIVIVNKDDEISFAGHLFYYLI